LDGLLILFEIPAGICGMGWIWIVVSGFDRVEGGFGDDVCCCFYIVVLVDVWVCGNIDDH
jgi:hypothetical protein